MKSQLSGLFTSKVASSRGGIAIRDLQHAGSEPPLSPVAREPRKAGPRMASAAVAGRAGSHAAPEYVTGGRVSPRTAESSNRPGGSVAGLGAARTARRRGGFSAMAGVLAVMLSVAGALPGPGARHLPPRLPASVVPRLGPRPCAEGPFAEGVLCALRLRGGTDAAAQVCPPARPPRGVLWNVHLTRICIGDRRWAL